MVAMLRSVLIGAGVLCFIGGIIALRGGAPFGLPAMIGGALLLVGTLFERALYKPAVKKKPGPNWTRTEERFYDEQSGKLVTVYIQPETGERSYVEE